MTMINTVITIGNTIRNNVDNYISDSVRLGISQRAMCGLKTH